MTICISAIALNKDKKECIVFSTDHMVSIGGLGQFEKEIKKYKVLNGNVIAMLSGQPLLFDRILEGAKDFHDFHKIRDKIVENLAKLRKDIIKKEIYDLFNIDENYIKQILPLQFQNPIMQKILETTSNFTLETSILLIGFDNSANAQITEIGEVGYGDYRDIHFHAIGSGSSQALNTLLFQKHSKNSDLQATIYSVYKAKRNAEVANGVGKETEIIILDGNKLYELPEEKIVILQNIYNEELRYGTSHKDLNNIFPSLSDDKRGDNS